MFCEFLSVPSISQDKKYQPICESQPIGDIFAYALVWLLSETITSHISNCHIPITINNIIMHCAVSQLKFYQGRVYTSRVLPTPLYFNFGQMYYAEIYHYCKLDVINDSTHRGRTKVAAAGAAISPRRHFWMHFVPWKCLYMYFDIDHWKLLLVVILQLINIGLDNYN